MKLISNVWSLESPAGTFTGRWRSPAAAAVLSHVLRLSFLCALCGLLFLSRLSERSLSSSHEARAAQNAQCMLDSGDWLLPRQFNGRLDLQKPPLYYWLVAAMSWLNSGVVTALTVRLPAALAAFACVLIVYFSLARRGRAEAGFCAAVILATCLHFTWLARVGRIDMPLTLAITVALISWPSAPGRMAALCMSVAVAFGILLKGPIAAVLVAVVVLVHIAVQRPPASRIRLALRSLLWGMPLVLLVAAPWFIYANWQTAGRLWQEFFVHHNLRRGLGGAAELNGEPIWYYVPRLAVDLLPWSLLVPLALWHMLKARSWRTDGASTFGLLWFTAIFGFLSLMHFKRADYLLPAHPGFAIWLGCELTSLSANAVRLRPFACTALRISIGMLVLVAVAGWQMHIANDAHSDRHAARRFAEEIRRRTQRPVIFFRTEAHEVAFHVGRPLDTILEWENLDFWACRPHPIYMVMPPDCADTWQQHLQSGRLERVMQIADFGESARPLVLMRSAAANVDSD